MQTIEATGHAALSPPIVQQRQVRIGGDSNTQLRSICDHVEEAGVHHRLSHSLQVQFLNVHELVNYICKFLEIYEGERPKGRAIPPELDRAHLAAQVTLTNWLDLNMGGELHPTFLYVF